MYNKFKSYDTWTNAIIGCLMAIIFFIAVNLLYATFTWLLWNGIMPSVFNLPSLTWVQMLGFYIMIRLFFGININFDKK